MVYERLMLTTVSMWLGTTVWITLPLQYLGIVRYCAFSRIREQVHRFSETSPRSKACIYHISKTDNFSVFAFYLPI